MSRPCPQAAELSIKFLSGDRAVEVVQVVGPRLAHLRKYNAVGERAATVLSPACSLDLSSKLVLVVLHAEGCRALLKPGPDQRGDRRVHRGRGVEQSQESRQGAGAEVRQHTNLTHTG